MDIYSYTSTDVGLSGRAGFQFTSAPDGASSEVLRKVESVIGYQLIPGLSPTPDREQLAKYPVKFAYYPDLLGSGGVLIRARYAGQDYSGRAGNFLGQAWEMNSGDLPAANPAIEYWSDSDWVDGPPVPAGMPPEGHLAHLWPTHAQRILATLTRLVRHSDDRTYVVGGTTEDLANFFASCLCLLPKDVADGMAFITYTDRPDVGSFSLVGVPEICRDLVRLPPRSVAVDLDGGDEAALPAEDDELSVPLIRLMAGKVDPEFLASVGQSVRGIDGPLAALEGAVVSIASVNGLVGEPYLTRTWEFLSSSAGRQWMANAAGLLSWPTDSFDAIYRSLALSGMAQQVFGAVQASGDMSGAKAMEQGLILAEVDLALDPSLDPSGVPRWVPPGPVPTQAQERARRALDDHPEIAHRLFFLATDPTADSITRTAAAAFTRTVVAGYGDTQVGQLPDTAAFRSGITDVLCDPSTRIQGDVGKRVVASSLWPAVRELVANGAFEDDARVTLELAASSGSEVEAAMELQAAGINATTVANGLSHVLELPGTRENVNAWIRASGRPDYRAIRETVLTDAFAGHVASQILSDVKAHPDRAQAYASHLRNDSTQAFLWLIGFCDWVALNSPQDPLTPEAVARLDDLLREAPNRQSEEAARSVAHQRMLTALRKAVEGNHLELDRLMSGLAFDHSRRAAEAAVADNGRRDRVDFAGEAFVAAFRADGNAPRNPTSRDAWLLSMTELTDGSARRAVRKWLDHHDQEALAAWDQAGGSKKSGGWSLFRR